MSILARIGRFMDRRELAKTLAMIDAAEPAAARAARAGVPSWSSLPARPPPPAPLRRLPPPVPMPSAGRTVRQ